MRLAARRAGLSRAAQPPRARARVGDTLVSGRHAPPGARDPSPRAPKPRATEAYTPRMPSNVEIKAIARDPHALREAASRLCAAPPETLRQEDTFFATARGRLKLRVIAAAGGGDRCANDDDASRVPHSAPIGELIFYERADTHGPRESAYVIAPVSDIAALRETLSRALGVAGVVRKTRTLYLAKTTRIHIDEVESLGTFVELETVLHPGQSIEEGTRITEAIMNSLGIARDDLIDRAYIDLLRGPA